jgi:murein DD-endopeptidase MepM/ murein hydrolase activator NlpD
MPLLLALALLTGCALTGAKLPPTLLPTAVAPNLPAPTRTASAPVSAQKAEDVEAAPEELSGSGSVLSLATVPTPEGTGIRPGLARQQYVPDAGPEAPAERRPPPYDSPLSLHPDDHYWMSRPIPSNRRNYDLEWYPFGNDVLIPELAPYRIHHGIDLPNDQGTPVLATGSGIVIHAGPLPSPNDGVNYYGNTVIVHHDWQWQGQDVYTLYAHTLELFVQVGDYVEQGQLIAGVGSSGEVTNSHLHLEVRVGSNSYGATRNPALWLVPYEGWGTLAGRLVDRRGRKIPGAIVTVIPVNIDVAPRVQRTYSPVVRSDDVWQENFVVGDLPAGRYTLLLSVNDITYRRDVAVFAGRTTFEIISTQFEYIPTATPLPTETPTATATLLGSDGTPAAEATATPGP